ncbi:MAG TPA: methionyl-tRNA formyltransferase [Conexibacter sp.]|nr:methionyl-tRNA formyltransferase [Conexibacter sp.]
MRTVYLGTSDFAAAVLERLADSPHRPVLVVTRPDRPKGRGRKLESPPVAHAARALGLDLAQPEDVNAEEARNQIAAASPDTVIVCAFGALLKEPLLSEHDMLNVHPSLLPRWRGAAPIERAMMAGDAETGVAIMRLTAGLDSGPVCLVEHEPIQAEDTFGTLSARLAELGSTLLLRTLDERPPFAEQPDEGVTYAEKITAEDRLLDPANRSADELDRTVRALAPHIGARLPLPDGSFLGVWGAQPAADAALAPGTSGNEGGRLVLGCAGRSALELTTVQPPGRRPMRAADYLRGHGLPGATVRPR